MPNITPAIIKHLLEDEEPDTYLETATRVRNQARVENSYNRAFGGPVKGDIAFNSGSRRFERLGGVWYVTRRAKNPAYWDQPQYFIIYPGPNPYAFIVCKQPRRLLTRHFRTAIAQIYRDAAKRSARADRIGVDGTEKAVYDARASGAKPEPAYEILIDGTWKRTSPVSTHA
jgi:hypothetical protein